MKDKTIEEIVKLAQQIISISTGLTSVDVSPISSPDTKNDISKKAKGNLYYRQSRGRWEVTKVVDGKKVYKGSYVNKADAEAVLNS